MSNDKPASTANHMITQGASEALEGIAERLGLDCDNYQNWDLLLDGIYRKIDAMKAASAGDGKINA